ncbi:MAG TPA: L,D-transpeptidase [Gemmatimonadaceae bacterium]|nr:L,D-transpeptidase [Gemmatimonadaceae bacterium]
MRAVIRTAAILGTISVSALMAPDVMAEGREGAQPNIVASISNKQILLKLGDSVVQTYYVATGAEKYPTPTGSFIIRKLTWNPSWTPPPDAKWARNKTATEPGDPKNPMKVVKIFFKEPDYYIHGTADVESIGSAASHGCLRMDPDEVMEVGKWVMENGGLRQQENWLMRLVHFRNHEKVIYLSKPVPIKVVA